MVSTPAILCRSEGAGRGRYEEYHPYGSTAWWAGDAATVSQKRYRYTGMERDEETGLQCHGVRYYAPWLGRWTSADPIGLGDGVNRYGYVHANPCRGIDSSGTRDLTTEADVKDYLMDRASALAAAEDAAADPAVANEPSALILYIGGGWFQNRPRARVHPLDTAPPAGSHSSGEQSSQGSPSSQEGVDDLVRNTLGAIPDAEVAVLSPGWSNRQTVVAAADYVDEQLEPGQKLVLVGYSFGGVRAVEVARELQARDVGVDLLVTSDPTTSDVSRTDDRQVDSVPSNVATAINYYQLSTDASTPVGQGLGLSGEPLRRQDGSASRTTLYNVLVYGTRHEDVWRLTLRDAATQISDYLRTGSMPEMEARASRGKGTRQDQDDNFVITVAKNRGVGRGP